MRKASLNDKRRPADVTDAVGIHRTNIIPFMAEDRSITLENASKLADVMGFDIRLVRRDGDGTPKRVDILSPVRRDRLSKSLSSVLAVLDAKAATDRPPKK